MLSSVLSGSGRRVIALTFLSLVFQFDLAVAESPESMLMRMQIAVDETNYQGTLLHMSSGHMEQFRVYHRVAEEGTTERMVLVDGAGAEIIRTPDEVICIFPEQSSVVIENRVAAQVSEGPLRAAIPSIADIAPEYYKLTMIDGGKVADRDSLMVAIRPQDEFRYGYRLWLDRETAMPLKSQLTANEDSMPVEEIRFVSISLPTEVALDEVQPAIDTSNFSVAHHAKAPAPEADNGEPVLWFANDLPPGFMLSMSRYEFMEGVESPRMHLVYTDGLASVSVFLDAVSAEKQTEGFSQMGAASAYSLVRNNLYITAMGEVPPVTTRQIAMSMSEKP